MLFRKILLGLALVFLFVGNTHAVNPDEVLDNPILEKRARKLSTEIRCMVCQNQSIDNSDASVAKDLRVLIRERIAAGDSDTQVLEYLVGRFGEFVLLKPRFTFLNAALWITPIIALLFGLYLLVSLSRRSSLKLNPVSSTVKSDLTKKEKVELTKILDE